MKTNIIAINSIFICILGMVFAFPFEMSLVFPADGYTTQQEVYSICGGTPFNVKSSLVLSIVTMCLPGILEKAYEWKQLKCESIKCSYEAVLNDLDPTFCEKQEAYRTCKYIIGEVFALPGFTILEYWRNAINQILANPVGILWSVGAKLARKNMLVCNNALTGGACSSLVIGSSAVFLAVTDIIGVYESIKNILANGFNIFSSNDKCEGIDEIKKEIDEILKYA